MILFVLTKIEEDIRYYTVVYPRIIIFLESTRKKKKKIEKWLYAVYPAIYILVHIPSTVYYTHGKIQTIFATRRIYSLLSDSVWCLGAISSRRNRSANLTIIIINNNNNDTVTPRNAQTFYGYDLTEPRVRFGSWLQWFHVETRTSTWTPPPRIVTRVVVFNVRKNHPD